MVRFQQAHCCTVRYDMLDTIYVPKIQLQTPRHEEDEKSVKRTKGAHRKMETLAEKGIGRLCRRRGIRGYRDVTVKLNY